MANDCPNTPMTTISAAMGYSQAATDESASRFIADQLHADIESTRKQHKKASGHTASKPSKSLKQVLKTLTSTKKSPRSEPEKAMKLVATHFHEGNNDTCDSHSTAEKPNHNLVQRDKPESQPSTHLKDDHVEHMPRSLQRRFGKAHEQCGQPSADPQSPLQARSNTASYGMILGGQIARSSSKRVPSTYYTPTNANSYAISGRSHLVSRNHIPSYQVEVHQTVPHSHIHAQPTASITAAGLAPEDPGAVNNHPASGAMFDWPNLEFHAPPPTATSTAHTHDDQLARDPRRSVSVPADMMRPTTLRGSAVPAPLNTNRTKQQTTTSQTPPSKQSHLDIHAHIDQVRISLETRMDRIEAKLDRVLSLAHHNDNRQKPQRVEGKMHGQTQIRSQDQSHKHKRLRQRDVRANLTGMPPHIPYGGIGLEGWYEAVSK